MMSARRGRVLLVEEGWHPTLRLARALEESGFAVTVLTANGSTATYRRKTVRWCCGPAVDHDDFVTHVDTIAAAHDRVLPLTESAMERLWNEAGATHKLFPRAEPWQRRLVLDKHALVEHMATRGIAVPRHRRVDAALDLEAVARELGLPVVVKGASGCGGRRVRIVDTLAALDTTLRRARLLGGEWIVQEHVASPTYLFGGVFHDGAPLRVYAAEKLAQHPPRTGVAIHLRSTRDRALEELGARVIRELRWTGFASADFVRRADGTFVLLEVNPRLWGSHAGAAAAGVDLFAPFAQLLAGETPRADLAFAANIETRIFPKYLRSAARGGARGALRGLRELFGDQGRDWRDPRFAIYLVRRERAMRRLIEEL
jgi:biotin carboxylase